MTNELWLRDDLVHVLNIVFSFTYSCMAVSEKAEAYCFWNLGWLVGDAGHTRSTEKRYAIA